MLADRAYISRLIEELFKNAGVASACGEAAPLTRRRRPVAIRRHDARRRPLRLFSPEVELTAVARRLVDLAAANRKAEKVTEEAL